MFTMYLLHTTISAEYISLRCSNASEHSDEHHRHSLNRNTAQLVGRSPFYTAVATQTINPHNTPADKYVAVAHMQQTLNTETLHATVPLPTQSIN